MIDTQVRRVTKARTNLFIEFGFSPTEARRLHVESRKQMSKALRARKRAERRRAA